ncbi:MAG: beta-lactamase family protein [Myxococcales bacterium]|nr:beta-lactamase family protein [Myxococcales bacterium]
MRRALAEDGGSAVSVAIAVAGREVFRGAVGFADLEQRVAATATTRLRIGSVSKTITAVIAARMHARGQLELDSPIARYLPELPTALRGITCEQLARHTSGVRHYDFGNLAEANNTRTYQDLLETLPLFQDSPLLFAPGAGEAYSSFGYNLLGMALQRAANRPFLELVANEARDLGLRDTLGDHPLAVIERRARFYTRYEGQLINTIWRDSSDFYPSGGLLTTPRDLVALALAAFESEKLAPARPLFTSSGALASGERVDRSVGFDIERDASDAIVRYAKGGETNGALALLTYAPARRVAIAAVSNYNVWPAKRLAFDRLARDELPALASELAA